MVGGVTPSELRRCLERIGWSQRQLSRELGASWCRRQDWATGRQLVPEHVAKWLRGQAEHALPRGWEPRRD